MKEHFASIEMSLNTETNEIVLDIKARENLPIDVFTDAIVSLVGDLHNVVKANPRATVNEIHKLIQS